MLWNLTEPAGAWTVCQTSLWEVVLVVSGNRGKWPFPRNFKVWKKVHSKQTLVPRKPCYQRQSQNQTHSSSSTSAKSERSICEGELLVFGWPKSAGSVFSPNWVIEMSQSNWSQLGFSLKQRVVTWFRALWGAS